MVVPLPRSSRHLDLNGDGSISLEEMAALMGELGVEEGAGAQAAEELMAAVVRVDSSAGGAGVDFPCFLDFCRKVRWGLAPGSIQGLIQF